MATETSLTYKNLKAHVFFLEGTKLCRDFPGDAESDDR